MCGRYVTISKLKEIEKRFNITVPEPGNYNPSANIAPGQYAPVITNEKATELSFLRFGLTPFWSKKSFMVINARAEGDHNKENNPTYTGAKGIIKKPVFRKPIRSQRCLIIADAFYEGPEKEKLGKPYLIYKKNKERPFAFAGLWDQWKNPGTAEYVTGFAIITTVANDLLQKIGHPRMPVILEKEDEKAWISDDTPLNEITAMLEPFEAENMNAYPVSPKIKNPRENQMELLKPTGQRIVKEYDYELYDEIALEGMGNTRARQRKNDQGKQGELF